MKKRTFLKSLAGSTLFSTSLYRSLEPYLLGLEHMSPEEVAEQEDFWLAIRRTYRLKPDYINLENGYYCLMPQDIETRYIDHLRNMNYQASYYMRTVQWDNKKAVADRLADLIGADHGEVIVTRNTTESLDTVIAGKHWEAGDEAIMAEQDYGAMINQFRLMADRYGIVNKILSVPNHPANDEEIVNLYAAAITPRTKLLMVCHMINITGQILPIRKICDMAHSKGVEVMVDGAHVIGQVTFNIKDLDCDYYGSSLHKWLSCPLGTGLLYVKKEKIAGLWPIYGDYGPDENNIARLNHTGTHPCHSDLAIQDAIEYYQMIGPQRKEARMRHLQNYWTSQVRDLPNVVVNTPADPVRSCGIANVGVSTMTPHEMADTLLKKYRIWTVAIDGQGVKGCRICPNVYTSKAELDVFVNAIKEMASS
ncbi:MAG TPA: aminotransferase class V-fold PLP-dependent enzyme [Saprospiraceae bacterium]|nr:aminotransferase class V-fold PLP-dependent enzyme [Saprospiraceae bacterium]